MNYGIIGDVKKPNRTEKWLTNPCNSRKHLLMMIANHRASASKPVTAMVRYFDVIEFASVADAQRWLIAEGFANTSHPYAVQVSKAARGIKPRCAGFAWRYSEKKPGMPPVRILKKNWREMLSKWSAEIGIRGKYDRSDRRKYLEASECKGMKLYQVPTK